MIGPLPLADPRFQIAYPPFVTFLGRSTAIELLRNGFPISCVLIFLHNIRQSLVFFLGPAKGSNFRTIRVGRCHERLLLARRGLGYHGRRHVKFRWRWKVHARRRRPSTVFRIVPHHIVRMIPGHWRWWWWTVRIITPRRSPRRCLRRKTALVAPIKGHALSFVHIPKVVPVMLLVVKTLISTFHGGIAAVHHLVLHHFGRCTLVNHAVGFLWKGKGPHESRGSCPERILCINFPGRNLTHCGWLPSHVLMVMFRHHIHWCYRAAGGRARSLRIVTVGLFIKPR